MSKHVLIFSLAYYPKFVGGAEIAIKEITDRISPEEIEFDMITLRLDQAFPKFEKVGNVNVYRVGISKKNPSPEELIRFPLYLMKAFFPIMAFLKAVFLHRKKHYDAMWSMMSYMGFPALFLKYFFPKIKFFLTLQEGDTVEHVTKRFRIKAVFFLYKRIFKKADFIQVISAHLENFARSMKAECPVYVVPNGVDLMKFETKDLKSENEDVRKNLGIKMSEVVLITSSRLVEKNAVGDIIEALIYLPKDIKLLIAGSGHLESDLKSQVVRLKLEERVVFLGYVPHQELPKYLHVSDVFIRPSLSEGMGNSFIEAMAAGIPVIATSVGGIPDFLKDKETGLFCAVRNPESIAESVNTLLLNSELRHRIVKNGKNLAREKYDWKLISQKMKKLFV